MITSILTLYFLGLTLLILSDFLGLSLFRFRVISVFIGVFVGYLLIISTYAIFKSNFNSIGFLVLFWVIGYVFYIATNNEITKIKLQDYGRRVLIIGVLWTLIFGLKASFFWNTEYACPNLLFIDNEYYMKVAEGYNLSGNENGLGLRNLLFPFLNFAQPYRSNDFWLVSLGLDLTKIDTIYIWELFYSTIIICICSLSLYTLLKTKFNLFFSLVLSVLLLFAFSGSWYRDLINLLFPNHSSGYDPIGILAYTKLALIFSVYFQFILKYEMGKKSEAIGLLILIPLLVQSTIAIFVIVAIILLFNLFEVKKIIKDRLKKLLPVIVIFTCILIGFFMFYYLNQKMEHFYVGYSNLKIADNTNVFDLAIQFIKKATLLFIAYYWLSFLLVLILLGITNNLEKSFRKVLFLFLVLFYFCSILVYVGFNKIGDAYQFSTNVFGPFVLSLLIYLLIQTPMHSIQGKLRIAFLMVISIVGMNEMIGGSNFFHSTTRINYYDKKFIGKVKIILPQLQYPLGLIYYGTDLQNYTKEDYPQYETTFLKLFGRNYTVFNIEADSLKLDYTNEANQKFNVSIKNNALNIWLHNSKRVSKTKEKLSRKDFYDAYPFSFCVSKISRDSLPDFIKADVVNVIKDAKSLIYFYTLKRKNTVVKDLN